MVTLIHSFFIVNVTVKQSLKSVYICQGCQEKTKKMLLYIIIIVHHYCYCYSCYYFTTLKI